jgi:hypothetical protein
MRKSPIVSRNNPSPNPSVTIGMGYVEDSAAQMDMSVANKKANEGKEEGTKKIPRKF